MKNKYEKTKKDSQNKYVKNIRIFLKKKKTKSKKKAQERYENFTENKM